jgi:hypothetical protein
MSNWAQAHSLEKQAEARNKANHRRFEYFMGCCPHEFMRECYNSIPESAASPTLISASTPHSGERGYSSPPLEPIAISICTLGLV